MIKENIHDLSKRYNLPQATLYTWLREKLKVPFEVHPLNQSIKLYLIDRETNKLILDYLASDAYRKKKEGAKVVSKYHKKGKTK